MPPRFAAVPIELNKGARIPVSGIAVPATTGVVKHPVFTQNLYRQGSHELPLPRERQRPVECRTHAWHVQHSAENLSAWCAKTVWMSHFGPR